MKEVSSRYLKVVFAVWIVLAVGGLFAFFTLYDQAFPAASIDLKIPKEELEKKSVEFANFLSYSPEKAVVATTFDSDYQAKTFLDYKLGGKKANELMRSEIPVWAWTTRICKPFSTEELYVSRFLDGKLQSFYHVIEKEKKVPSVSHERAREMVLEYARKHTRLKVDDWKVVEDKQDKRVNRVDHLFVFEDQSRDFDEAKIRAKFRVYGNYVGSFSEFLHIPEDFTRHYNKLRSNNRLLQSIASSLGYVLDGACVIVFIWAVAKRQMRWAFVKKTAIVSFAVLLLYMINTFPSLVYSYDTSKAFFDYMLMGVSTRFLGIIFLALMLSFLIGSAEALYRKFYPDSLALENIFSKKAVRSKVLLVGLCLAFLYLSFSLGYQTLFYVIGKSLGVWCPIDIREEQALGMIFPASYAMYMGYVASISEELIYRVLGIVLFTRLLRNVWLANLLQAVLWGFAHSSYPQQPAFTRGVELSIEGFISGFFFIKFGLLPSLVSHYLFNVSVSSIPSFLAESMVSRLSATIPYIPPILWLCFVIYQIKKKGIDEEVESLNNKNIEIEEAPVIEKSREFCIAEKVEKPRWKFLTWVVPLALVFALVGYFHKDKSREIGAEEKQSLAREVLIDKTRKILEGRGISTRGYRVVTWCSSQVFSDRQEFQYLFEKSGYEKTNQYAKNLVPTIVWNARWFKPLTPQEYRVELNNEGKLRSIIVKLHENDKADELTEDEAKQMASMFLDRHHKEFKGYEFSTIEKDVRKNRVDYTVKFEMPEHKVGEAPLMVTVEVVGAKIGNFYTGWQVPNKWILEHDKKPFWKVIIIVWRYALIAGLLLFGLYAGVKLITREGVSKKMIFYASLAGATLSLISDVNSWPSIYQWYSTETPMAAFESRQLFNKLYYVLQSAVFYAVVAVGSCAAARAILPGNMGDYLRQFYPARFSGTKRDKSIWLESFLLFLAAVLITAPIGFMQEKVTEAYSPTVNFVDFALFSYWECFSPLVSIVESLASGILAISLTLPIAVYVYKNYVRNFKRVLLILAMTLPFPFADNYFIEDAFFDATFMIVGTLTVYFIVVHVLKNNFLAYLLSVYWMFLLGAGYGIWKYIYPAMKFDLIVVILLVALPFIILLDDVFFVRRKQKT